MKIRQRSKAMKMGFTKDEVEVIGKHVGSITSAIDGLSAFLQEEYEKVEMWIDDRSDKWKESEAAEEWLDWLNALDGEIDRLEAFKEDLGIDEEVLG